MDKASAIYWVRTKVSKQELRMISLGEEYTDTFQHRGKTVILHIEKDEDHPNQFEVMFSMRGEDDHHFTLTKQEVGL